MTGYREDIVPLFARDYDWDVETLLQIASVYSEVSMNTGELVQLACSKGVTIAEAFGECVKAQRQIAERVRQLKAKEVKK